MVPHHMFERAGDKEHAAVIHNAYQSLLEQVLGNRLAMADTNASRGAASVETANLESCYGGVFVQATRSPSARGIRAYNVE